MRTERVGLRGGRRLALLLGALLLAGCAEIPSGGAVGVVGDAPAIAQPSGQLVRVFAEGPRDGDDVYSIVSGFLEASSTVEDDLRTARKYLTRPAAGRWRSSVGVSVYDHTQLRISARGSDRLEFSAPAEGSIDAQGVFRAAPPGKRAVATFGLTRVAGNWRIDNLPDGLLISRQDFEREYAPVDLHFLAGGEHSPVLVPDPVHLRRLPSLPTELVTAQLRGPSRWLAPAVRTAIPRAAALAGPVEVSSGVARVELVEGSVPTDGVARDTMLGQLVLTLTDVPAITAVEVNVAGRPATLGGRGASRLTRADVALFQPADLRPPPPSAYYLREGISYVVGPPGAQGPFGPDVKLAEIAVAPGGRLLAGISADRQTLWTTTRDQPKKLATRLRGSELSSASFDQDGNLWVLDGPPQDRVLHRVPPTGDLETAAVTGFVARQVIRLRVSSDGIRLALVLDTVEGTQAFLALVTGAGGDLRVGSLRRLGYQLVGPADIAWAEPDRLAVLAAARDAAPQPYALSLGGQVADLAPSLAEISGLAAAPGQPMIATTANGLVYRLRPGGGWFRVGTGTVATYPG